MTLILPQKRFSWLYESTDENTKPDYDKVIIETHQFAVLPSLGSLVPGWVLIIPKRPAINFSQLNNSELKELPELINEISIRQKIFDNDIFIFEHGGSFGSSIACGVDQAHLHLVPLNFNLYELVHSDSSVQWQEIENINSLNKSVTPECEYLFLSNFTNTLFGKPKIPTSQWFRKIIANKIGLSDEWNYRKFPRYDVVEETYQKMVS